MKKTMKKMTAGVLAAAVTMSMLVGCGGNDKQTTSDGTGTEGSGNQSGGEAISELTLPLSEEKQELNVWLVYSGTVVSDLNEIAGIKKMEELTNVHINWTPVNQDELQDKYGTLVASGNYPDIIYAGSIEYPGGFETGVADGVIYDDMDTLIRNYMPNYMALLESSDEARREATADSGKMVICKNIVGTDTTAQSEGTYMGLAYRADILEKLGLDVPTTIDEWHDALVAAKEAGVATPFVLDQNGGSSIALSWGVCTTSQNYLQLDGDKVVMSQALDGYGDYLETMRQWYSEGLINPNFSTFNFYLDTPASVEAGDTLLYSMILSGFTGNNYFKNHMCTVEDEYLQPIVAPLVKTGDTPVQAASRIIAKDPIYITTACENPELAAKWLDFQYSEQGQLLNWYGIEGETYTLDADGKPQFTDKVLNSDKAPSDILQEYALNWGNCWLGKHDIEASWKISTAVAGGQNQELEAVDIWSEPETNVYLTMSITLTDAESMEVTNTLTALKTMIDEYTMNYIVGQDVEPFADFQAELEANGLQNVLDVYQAAYDRYLAR